MGSGICVFSVPTIFLCVAGRRIEDDRSGWARVIVSTRQVQEVRMKQGKGRETTSISELSVVWTLSAS